MTPTTRHFDTRPEEFDVSIDTDMTLLSAEWRKNITENEDGSFDARCCFVPCFIAASKTNVANTLVGIYMKCTDADKGDMMTFYAKAQAYADRLFPEE